MAPPRGKGGRPRGAQSRGERTQRGGRSQSRGRGGGATANSSSIAPTDINTPMLDADNAQEPSQNPNQAITTQTSDSVGASELHGHTPMNSLHIEASRKRKASIGAASDGQLTKKSKEHQDALQGRADLPDEQVSHDHATDKFSASAEDSTPSALPETTSPPCFHGQRGHLSTGVNQLSDRQGQPGVNKSRGELDTSLPPISNHNEIFRDLAMRAIDLLGLRNVVQHFERRPLRVATVCSGTDAPLWGLLQLNQGNNDVLIYERCCN